MQSQNKIKHQTRMLEKELETKGDDEEYTRIGKGRETQFPKRQGPECGPGSPVSTRARGYWGIDCSIT